MSINVTVNGNRLNICRGRMVLSDLDQIKKNERDRRRRLRLEQVRQQSKKISDRLLERTKNIAQQELKKIDDNDKVCLKHLYNAKVMEVQQKYQEDMADIGQAHISAALEPNHDAIMEKQEEKNKSLALKRGKEAIKLMKNAQQMESAEQQHQERLRQVREVENLRSTMIAKLPKKVIPDMYTVCVSVANETDEENWCQSHVKNKTQKICTKQSPGKVTKPYIKPARSDIKLVSQQKMTLEEIREKNCPTSERQPVIDIVAESLTEQTRCATESEYNDKNCAKEIINNPTNVNKSSRYNPEDYVQTTSDPTNSDSSNSFSDDSSYFSDSGDQYMTKEVKMIRHVKCPTFDKVQLYDHDKHQSNLYDQPLDVVEKIHTWKEPSAIDLAQEIERATAAETHLLENRKLNTQKRGEDAALREKVRRDYQNLMRNLSQLASEERKLKASQTNSYPKDVYIQEERRKILRSQHKKKLNHALSTLLNEEQCLSCSAERPITLTPREHESNDIPASWEDPISFSQRVQINKPLQVEHNENSVSREEQILDMLKKVERQKRLLLQEFGADLPNEIFNVSVKSLFEKDKSVQTEMLNSKDTHDQILSPEVKVINVLSDEKNNKDKSEEKSDTNVKKVETAVQTITGPRSILQDKSTQVELEQEKESVPLSDHEKVETITQHYPIEPQIIIVRPEMDSSDSTSSESTRADNNRRTIGVTPKKKRYITKTKRTPSKGRHKSCSTKPRKIVSPVKKICKVSSELQSCSPNKYPNVEDAPSKKIKMYVDKNGVNIKVKPSKVAQVAVDMSAQSTQIYTTGIQGQPMTKSQWVQTKSKRIKIKDMSDTSTTFASPPPIKPRDLFEVLNNNMSILEMLDSSANETIRRLRKDVSPVSTPETPSPRTMMMPSNVPHPEKLKKLLGFTSTDSYTNDHTTPSSSNNDYSTSTNLSEYRRNEHIPAESITTQTKVPISLEFCLCNNPECKQMHAKFDKIRTYALKNCPQILQKYEDLQTTCAERIVSLTNLIEKVRNEQRGMEFSMIDHHDEINLMQIPSQVVTNSIQSVRVLVENIEAIHNQLTKTLKESQKIIKGKVDVQENTDEIKETVPSANDEMSTNDNIIEEKVLVDKGKIKPKIINEEKVNVQFKRCKVQNLPQNLTSATPKRSIRFPSQNFEEDMIEKLSKEILEQSEGINNNFTQSKQSYNPTTRLSIQTPTSTDDFKAKTSTKMQKNDIGTKRQINRESKKAKDFVPLLTDIPRMPKATENSVHSNNARSKPPVSLLSGPHRSEIESSGHELSTIIEFDTTDTVNKSHNNRSPLSRKTIAETHIIKPTVHKAPEHNTTSYNAHNTSSEKICNLSITKLSSIECMHKGKEVFASFDALKTSKNIENQRMVKDKDFKLENVVQETNDKKLEYDTVNQGSLQVDEIQRFCSINVESNDKFSNKDKITSTSSNSFSDLSGISQIASTPSSTILKYASSPEEIETALKKLGLGWAITTLKKTREASALSSSSNSDITPINTVKRIISPVKKQFDGNYGLPDFSDVSSISIKEASKSTEQAVLLRGRTSTPKVPNSNSNSGETNISNMNNSENFQEPDNGLIIPKMTLAKSKPNLRKLEDL